MYRTTAVLSLAAVLLGADLHSEIIVAGNGKETVVADGGQVTVNGQMLTVKTASTNIFKGGLCEFRLGKQFALEKDEDDDDQDQYTFDGANVIFDVYELKPGGDPRPTVDLAIAALALAMKKLDLKRMPSTPIEILGAKVPGEEVLISLAGVRQRHSFYVVKKGALAVVLKFQYTDDAVDVAEYTELVATLRKTFRLIDPAEGAQRGTKGATPP